MFSLSDRMLLWRNSVYNSLHRSSKRFIGCIATPKLEYKSLDQYINFLPHNLEKAVFFYIIDVIAFESSLSVPILEDLAKIKSPVVYVINKIDVLNARPSETVVWARKISKYLRNQEHVFAVSSKKKYGLESVESELSQMSRSVANLSDICIIGPKNSGKTEFSKYLMRNVVSKVPKKTINNEIVKHRLGDLTLSIAPSIYIEQNNCDRVSSSKHWLEISVKSQEKLTFYDEGQVALEISPQFSCKLRVLFPRKIRYALSSGNIDYSHQISIKGSNLDDIVIDSWGILSIVSVGQHCLKLSVQITKHIFRRPSLGK
jgi:hypothetical protein